MNLKGIFLIVYFLITLGLFTNLDASFAVFSSFFLNAVLLTFIIIYHLYYENDNSPFISSYIVFNFLFFLVAPIVQISSFTRLDVPKYVNFFPYSESLAITSNVFIFIFNFFVIIFYIQFKKKKIKITKHSSISSSTKDPLYIFGTLILSIIIFIISIDFVLKDLATPSWLEYKASVAQLLVFKKVLFMVPFAGIILSFTYLKSKNKITNNTIIIFLCLVLFFILMFWFKNPFTEKRNALGPIYLTLVFLFFPKIFSNNTRTLSVLFFIMILLFPLSSMLTHTDATFYQIINNPQVLLNEAKYGGIVKTFNTLHYDAFANINATIKYVSINGISYGYQLLSALLFFIPRSIWEMKPLSTGQLIGEDLINNYGFNFSNLSNPLVSEAYINFGFLGIFLFAIIFSYLIVKILRWLQSDNVLKKMMSFYLAIHLLFLLRGDFTNGFSYYIGTLFGVLLIPKIVRIIIDELLKLNKLVKH
jgi:hypothetical protein